MTHLWMMTRHRLPDVLQLSPIQASTDGNTYFEDSLCMEDNTQLPIEQSSLPHESAKDSALSEGADKEKR